MACFIRILKLSMFSLALVAFVLRPVFVYAYNASFNPLKSEAFSLKTPPSSGTPILEKSPSLSKTMRVLEREKDPSASLGLQVSHVRMALALGKDLLAPSKPSNFSPQNFLVLRI